ncbi:MAG: hypothetical protein OEV78_12475, partial [Spirochaetia bacterium]|nr:hypothetical protein [Spirochaetia bacterium]
ESLRRKLQESRMRENRTYGLTRGLGETLNEGSRGLLYDAGVYLWLPALPTSAKWLLHYKDAQNERKLKKNSSFLPFANFRLCG